MEDERIEDPESGVWGKRHLGIWGRALGPHPVCTWYEVSLEILLVAPPVLGIRCRSDVSWEESILHPSPRHPTPLLPQGLLPGPQVLPAAPSAAQSTSA